MVGDAAMSPFEILYPGGSVEHYNEQPGTYWLNKLKSHFTKFAWLNPYPEEYWDHHESNRMIREILKIKCMQPLLRVLEKLQNN